MTNPGLKGTKMEKCDQNQEREREQSGVERWGELWPLVGKCSHPGCEAAKEGNTLTPLSSPSSGTQGGQCVQTAQARLPGTQQGGGG